ncbi:hypothetical protein WJX84_001402 [Apatococcus fuscideae]|uniref:Calnexin n=1 Tax=Apatococcus fuscideae TaxID=2026836 RepID=A0AAW1SRY8_9CHLO
MALNCRWCAVLLVASALLNISLPAAYAADAAFFDEFGSGWESRWISSSDSKYNGKLTVESPKGLSDPALKVPSKARHYGLSTRLAKPVNPAEGLVLQYDLKLAEGLSCGGAYLKFVSAAAEFDPETLVEATPYSVMFGPDKCGSTNKVHLILKHKSPTGAVEEKHLEFPPSVNLDSGTHTYTAILNTDNTYAVLIDGEEKKTGSLFEDFKPSINPPKEIDDPEDTKPEDWVDEAKIADPEASKPEDWDEDAPREVLDEEAEKPEGWLDDEPAEIDDPEASQPEDWDEEEDGEWEPPKITNPKCTDGPGCGEWKRPTIPNPAYKGKWSAPYIDNPAYKGIWAPQKIANPDYFDDETPLSNIAPIGGVALEIWTMDEGYFFDNVLVANDADIAADHRERYTVPKQKIEAEIKAKEDAEAAEKAAAASSEDGESLADKITERFVALFDHPSLASIKAPLQPYLDQLEDSPNFIWAVIAVPALLLLLLLSSLLRPKKARKPAATPVGKAKKQDITATADDVVQQGQEGLTAAAQKTTTAARQAASNIQAAVAGDDEDEAASKAPRRRREQ